MKARYDRFVFIHPCKAFKNKNYIKLTIQLHFIIITIRLALDIKFVPAAH